MDVLIDYFKFTSKVHSWPDLVELLGLGSVIWESGKARDGWSCH